MATVCAPASTTTANAGRQVLASTYRMLAGATIFAGSFLLFQIQPILAKQILPWFGGSAAVWTTCLLFFQGVLFLGYLYAHLLLTRVPAERQKWVHGALMLVSLAALPAIPSAWWKPAGAEEPILRILGLLTLTVGLPYLLISATSPLVQGWLARVPGAKLPYRFYALSNAASLGALVAYPVLIEPWLKTQTQAWVWSVLYVAFVVLCGMSAWLAPGATEAREKAGSGEKKMSWVLLAAVPSILSLAVTNHLGQNVAAVPFLWVLPLSVYLLTLILCFEGNGWYRRVVFLPLFGAMLLGAEWMLLQGQTVPVKLAIPFFAAFLFVACMVFHGELARRKPGAEGLSAYYLMMSAGGALGALAVAVGAPYWLSGNYEMPLAVAVCAMGVLFLEYKRHWTTDVAWVALAITAVLTANGFVGIMKSTSLVTSRNFYGGLRIVDANGMRTLVHGTVSHGAQFQDAARRRTATTYFAAGSGIQQAIEGTRRPGQKVGIVGLGAGTLASYGRAGDSYRFYELNPAVTGLAQKYFSYLRDTPAKVDVVTGDARLVLEREASQQFDLLVVDAFSGDSIPLHLLSHEAMAVYFRHLKADGVLALHVSNISLDLVPAAARLAAATGHPARHYHAATDAKLSRFESDWLLVSAGRALPSVLAAGGREPRVPAGTPLWTDDRSNLFQVLK